MAIITDGNSDILIIKQDWGLTVILGIHPSPKLLPIHPMELFQGRRIVGSVFGGFKGKTQLPRFAKECMDGVWTTVLYMCSLGFNSLLISK